MARDLIIKNLAELGEEHAKQAVEIYVDSFYERLSFFSSDPDVIADALQNAFLRNHCYVGLLNDNVVGLVAYSTRDERAYHFDRNALVRHLGLVKGSLACIRLRNELEQPLDILEHQCYIESVATDAAYRGKGISTKLQKHLFEILPYEEYIIEINDANFNVIRLYEKLGFSLCDRKPHRLPRKWDGSDGRVCMKKAVSKTSIAK